MLGSQLVARSCAEALTSPSRLKAMPATTIVNSSMAAEARPSRVLSFMVEEDLIRISRDSGQGTGRLASGAVAWRAGSDRSGRDHGLFHRRNGAQLECGAHHAFSRERRRATDWL